MSGIRVNSFVNQEAPSVALHIKQDEEKNTSWKAYAAAGTAIAGIAFAAGSAWSASFMNSGPIDMKGLSQQVYSAFASNSLKPEQQETANKVRDIVVAMLADKKIDNDKIITVVMAFAKDIDSMLTKFPDAAPEEIALLSASEAIWNNADLNVDPTNELVAKVFESSCKELNLNYKELTQTLSNRFNDPTINEDARSFIDHNREAPCQYPYCENWTPTNSKNLMEDDQQMKKEILRSDSISSQSKLISPEQVFEFYATKKGLSPEYRNAGLVVLSHFKEMLDRIDIEYEWGIAVAPLVPHENGEYKKNYPDSYPLKMAVLHSFITRLDMNDEYNNLCSSINLH